MTPRVTKAIDVSIYTGKVTLAQMQAVKDAGYGLVIVGLWHGQSKNPYAQQQTEMAWRADLEEGYYCLIAPPSWTSLSPKEQVKTGVWAAPTCTFFAIDAEIDITPDMIVEALAEAAKYGRPCIYTGAWWWNWFILRYHDWFYGHPGAFADVPAWLADYDWEPVLDTPRLAHLGPVVGKQFKGTTYEVGGINADLNVFDAEWLGLEDEMAAQRIFVAVEGRTEVYERMASGLVHITSPDLFVSLGGDWPAVRKYPFGDPIWDLPVLFPAGMPASLKVPD